MAKFRAERIRTPARYDIPGPLALEIGRFLATWAHFEHYVQTTIWSNLGLGAEAGRIAVREPRVTERLDMISDIAELGNLEMDYVLLRDIRKRADSLAGKRHLLAHCLWTEDRGVWCALVTRGSWAETQEEIEDYPSGSKAVQPEARPVTDKEVADWTKQTAALIEDLKNLGKQHRPLPPQPSQKKRRSQSAP
jgi:hypothetical protein